jgi:hypothetical protein
MAAPLWGGSSGGSPRSLRRPSKLGGMVRIPQIALSPRNLIKSTIVPRRASGRRDGDVIALVGSFWKSLGTRFSDEYQCVPIPQKHG